MRALTLVLLLLAAGPSPARDGPLHPAPAVWRTATLGRPGPAAPGWARTSSVIRDAHGDTEYRWGLIPAGLTQAGAFLDATAWRTVALAARSNAGPGPRPRVTTAATPSPPLPLCASPSTVVTLPMTSTLVAPMTFYHDTRRREAHTGDRVRAWALGRIVVPLADEGRGSASSPPGAPRQAVVRQGWDSIVI